MSVDAVRKLWCIAALCLLASPSLAAQWQVDATTSKLMFEAEHAGEKFKGSFPKFTAAIDFDEAAPEKGKISVTIDMASATADGKDRQDSLPTDDWFAVKQFPTATFTSTAISRGPIEKTGRANYIAKGNLAIKGIAKEIELPFSLQTTGKSTIARGSVTLNRSDFGVGSGQWKSDEWVKFPVRVFFEINATKAQ